LPERWRQLAVLSLGELLALSLWFSVSAVLPALRREWALGDAGSAALTVAVQLGFITGTLGAALANLPDIWPARRVMVAGTLLGAAANAWLALAVDSLAAALALRFVTGVAMAGAYPPAMKIMATWFREGRGLAIGILVGALTVGSAMPHLIRGLTDLPWRQTRDPWAILASEVMLQQTQAPRVVPKWLAFVDAYPTPSECAAASLGDVLRHRCLRPIRRTQLRRGDAAGARGHPTSQRFRWRPPGTDRRRGHGRTW